MTARKQHTRLEVEEAIELVRRNGGIASVTEVADQAGVSLATARRKLDGGLARGLLIRDTYNEAGQLLTHERWRYGLSEEGENMSTYHSIGRGPAHEDTVAHLILGEECPCHTRMGKTKRVYERGDVVRLHGTPTHEGMHADDAEQPVELAIIWHTIPHPENPDWIREYAVDLFDSRGRRESEEPIVIKAGAIASLVRPRDMRDMLLGVARLCFRDHAPYDLLTTPLEMSGWYAGRRSAALEERMLIIGSRREDPRDRMLPVEQIVETARVRAVLPEAYGSWERGFRFTVEFTYDEAGHRALYGVAPRYSGKVDAACFAD